MNTWIHTTYTLPRCLRKGKKLQWISEGCIHHKLGDKTGRMWITVAISEITDPVKTDVWTNWCLLLSYTRIHARTLHECPLKSGNNAHLREQSKAVCPVIRLFSDRWQQAKELYLESDTVMQKIGPKEFFWRLFSLMSQACPAGLDCRGKILILKVLKLQQKRMH